MTNILTASEAANALRTASTDQVMLDLLPAVDQYIQQATGRDWTADNPISPLAKAAARIVLTNWFENPAMIGNGITSLELGLTNLLVQLEAITLEYKEFAGINGAGYSPLPGARVGDTIDSLIGLIGDSGDQSAAFESVISLADYIYQQSTDDLSEKFFRVRLIPLGSL